MAEYTWGKVKLEGFKELHEALKKLPEEVGKKIAQDATRAGANIVRDSIKARIPIVTGNLARSISTWKRTRGGATWIGTGTGAIIQYSVGGRGKRGKHLHLVELGTKPHQIIAGGKEFAHAIQVTEKGKRQLIIKTGRKKVLYNKRLNKFFGKQQTISAKPHPFLMPAFLASKDNAINRIKTDLGRGIEKEYKRMTK